MTENILCVILYCSTLLILCIVSSQRFSALYSAFVASIAAVLSIASYFILQYLGIGMYQGRLIAILLPIFCVSYYLSAYRGYKFIFAFFSVAQIMLMLQETVKGLQGLFKYNDITMIFTIAVTNIAAAYLAYRLHLHFKDNVAKMQKGWGYLALLSVMIYLLIFVSANYPTAIAIRLEYYPTLLLVAATDITMYCVIYSFISARCHSEQLTHDDDFLHAQLALKNSQLEVQKLYYKLAHTDAMTQLANRAAYEQNSQDAKANWDKLMPAVCFSCDLNNLKNINDTYGHSQGDEVIYATAQILLDIFPDTPEVYRMGGDEFLVMGYRVQGEDASARLIRLRSSIALYNREHSQEKDKINLAIGLAETKDANISFDELLKIADEKMYEDKRSIKI
ncbi:MAG: GGDEF domain-containing protein [Oscillospiraceae bacterium]